MDCCGTDVSYPFLHGDVTLEEVDELCDVETVVRVGVYTGHEQLADAIYQLWWIQLVVLWCRQLQQLHQLVDYLHTDKNILNIYKKKNKKITLFSTIHIKSVL